MAAREQGESGCANGRRDAIPDSLPWQRAIRLVLSSLVSLSRPIIRIAPSLFRSYSRPLFQARRRRRRGRTVFPIVIVSLFFELYTPWALMAHSPRLLPTSRLCVTSGFVTPIYVVLDIALCRPPRHAAPLLLFCHY